MSTSTLATESVASPPTAYRWRWTVLATVLIAEIMDLVDATIVNIAAPSIRAELGGSESAMQWMLAGYTLAFAIGLITFGRLGDLVGRRRLFVIGALGFTVASAVCGLATSPEVLIGSRVAQGLLGAVMILQGLRRGWRSLPSPASPSRRPPAPDRPRQPAHSGRSAPRR